MTPEHPDAGTEDRVPHRAPHVAATYQHLELHGLLRELAARPLTASDLDEGAWRSMLWLITFRIQEHGPALDRPGWAACSRAYLDVLAHAVEAGACTAEEALVRRLHLTAFALDCAAGADDDVPLLGARRGVDLAVEALPTDRDAVAADAARWHTLPPEDVRRLRRVKNLLTPALAVSRWADRRLDGWVEVYPRLP